MWKDAIFGSADITQQSRTSELVSLFLWNGCSTSIFHGSVDLDNTQLMSLLNITGVIYKQFVPQILTAVPSVARTNVVSVNILASTE